MTAYVLVSGGSGGIGAALCRAMPDAGLLPIVGYATGEARARSVAEKSRGLPLHLDLTDPSSIDRALERLLELGNCGAEDCSSRVPASQGSLSGASEEPTSDTLEPERLEPEGLEPEGLEPEGLEPERLNSEGPRAEGTASGSARTQSERAQSARAGASGPVELVGVVLAATAPLELVSLGKASSRALEQQWQIHVSGPQRLLSGLVRDHFRKRRCGKVVGVLSRAMGVEGGAATPMMGPYVIAKYGLKGLLAALRGDYPWLEVGCVTPGFTRTRLLEAFDSRFLEQLEQQEPFSTPESVAGEILERLRSTPASAFASGASCSTASTGTTT